MAGGNTLGFGLKLDGSPAVAAELQRIITLQQKLFDLGKAGSGLGKTLASIAPKYILGSGELQAKLAEMTKQGLTKGAKAAAQSFPFGAFVNQTMGIGAGQNRPSRSAYQQFWMNAVPPQLVPPVIPKGVNWKQAGLGALVSPFSPWIGARALGGSGIFGGGGSGAALGLFGQGGIVGFAAAFLAVKVATEGLRIAFEHLKSAVEEGSKLYQQSARTAVGTGKLFQLQSIGQSIGLSASQMENLIVRGEHPLRGGGAVLNQKDMGQMFGAGRGVAQIGELQQIKNLSEYIKRAWIDTASAAYQMQQNAKPLQEFHYQLSILSIQWKTTWADLATAILPAVKTAIAFLVNELGKFQAVLSGIVKLEQMLGLVPKGEPGKNIIPSPSTHHGSSGSPWERMGFVMSGVASHDYAKKTSENTKAIAVNTQKTAEVIAQMVKGGTGLYGPKLLNLP